MRQYYIFNIVNKGDTTESIRPFLMDELTFLNFGGDIMTQWFSNKIIQGLLYEYLYCIIKK